MLSHEKTGRATPQGALCARAWGTSGAVPGEAGLGPSGRWCLPASSTAKRLTSLFIYVLEDSYQVQPCSARGRGSQNLWDLVKTTTVIRKCCCSRCSFIIIINTKLGGWEAALCTYGKVVFLSVTPLTILRETSALSKDWRHLHLTALECCALQRPWVAGLSAAGWPCSQPPSLLPHYDHRKEMKTSLSLRDPESRTCKNGRLSSGLAERCPVVRGQWAGNRASLGFGCQVSCIWGVTFPPGSHQSS